MELLAATVVQWGNERAIKTLSIREQACLSHLVLLLMDAAGIAEVENSSEILHGLLNVCSISVTTCANLHLSSTSADAFV
jgi:hypothetical protein